MSKNRLEEIDILRGIAFLAVVLQHVIAGLFYLPNINAESITLGTVLLAAIRFAVPLFVFITGVVLFYNYDRKINYKSFIKKRFVQVIVPYIIWTIFYFVWIKFLFGITTLGTWNALKEIGISLITGTGNYHLWFMVMIIPFYFLFPFFKIIISKDKKFSWNLTMLIVFLVFNFFLLYLLSKGSFSNFSPKVSFITNYLDRNSVFWVFYFVFGGFVGVYYKQFIVFVKKIKFLNLLIWIVSIFLIYKKITEINKTETINNYLLSANITSPLDPIMYPFLISSILLVFWVSHIICNKMMKLSKLLNVFGKYSFGGYLIHAFVLKFTNDYVIQFIGDFNIYLLTIVSFTLCSTISVVCCILISKIKIPLGESIVGKI
ncbi:MULTISPECIES: acyltransferase [Lysinibacillus]|uniref:Acyltransferase n=1 Tax=Lysinibacillus xylanilyticus TaxID=582475 RepID=A0ABV3VWM7_9BACI